MPDYTELPTYEFLLKDEYYFKIMVEKLLKSKGDPQTTRKICGCLRCDYTTNKSRVKKPMSQIRQVIKKIEALDYVTEADRKYLKELFSVFLTDHELCLCILEKKWKAAKNLSKYLVDEGSKLIPLDGWTDIFNFCSIMEMIEKGESKESIQKTKVFKDTSYELMRYKFMKDDYGELFPEMFEYMSKK